MIANCGHDERGAYKGGSAGDQTGEEYYVRTWYNRPWYCVLRYPDQRTALMIAQISRDAANNNNIGYDQNQRLTFYNNLAAAGWNPSAITTRCESDCSASTAACIIAAGHKVGNSALTGINPSLTTYYMRSALQTVGFQLLTDSRYLTSDSYLLPGDVLLKDDAHVAVNLDSGANSGSNVIVSSGGEFVSTYKPRLSAPSASDPNWINVAYGGKNRCIVRNSAYSASPGDVLPNCFTGDTKIQTKDGLIELGKNVGNLHQIATVDDTYRWAEIKCFGKQYIWRVTLSNGHTYECSGNHRWIIYITKTDYMIVHTVELQRGMMLRNFQTTEFIYVVDIKFTGEQDYVFCPVEPITHSCVLKYGEITGQCTGYAWGRFMEILGDTPKLSTANAGMWYGYTQDGYQRGQTPKLGAVACWSKPGAAGHVAIVEEIHDDGSITLGQSGYSSQNRFWTGKGSPPNYYHSPYVFQGFIYNPNAGTATGTFGMVGGDLYDELNDEDDAIMREVAYMTGHNPTTEQMMQTVRLSVINYTTALNSFFKGAISTPGTSGVVGEGVTFDTSILGPVPTQVIQSLTAHGTTVAGAIGVCANMYYESRFQPGVVEHGYTIATGGVGLCQWTNTPRGAATGRATNMMNFVGPNWRTDVSGQCEFLIHELTTIYTSVWAVLTTAPNSDAGAQQAADIFLRRFEVPANMEYNSRIRRAKASEFWSQIAPQLTA